MDSRTLATRGIGLVIVLVCVGYFVTYAVDNLEDIPALDVTSPRVWTVVAVTTGLYTASMAALALAWVVLMRSLGAPMPVRPAVGVVFTSQIGKYLPSNVLHFVGRVALARQLGFSLPVASASLVFEIVWMLGVGMLVTLLWLASAGAPPVLVDMGARTPALLLAVPVALSLWPPFLRRLAGAVGDRIPRLAALRDTSLPGFGAVAACLVLFGVNYVLMGLNLRLLTGLFVDGALPLGLASFVGLGGAAWLIGFITPGSPGGLGVRETLLVGFLSPSVGPGAAIGATLSFRLVSVVADGLAFVLGSALLAGQTDASGQPLGSAPDGPKPPPDL